MAASDSFARRLCPDLAASSHEERASISRVPFRILMIATEVAADVLACAVGIFAATWVCLCFHIGDAPQQTLRHVVGLGLISGLVAVFLLHAAGEYRGVGSLLQIRQTELVLRVASQLLLLLLLLNYAGDFGVTTALAVIASILIPLFMSVEKQLLLTVLRSVQLSANVVDRAMILGTGEAVRQIASVLLYSPRLGIRPIAAMVEGNEPIDDCLFEWGYRRGRSVPVIGGPITAALLKSLGCSRLVVASNDLLPEKIARAINAAKQARIQMTLLDEPALTDWQWTEAQDVDGLRMKSLGEPFTFCHYAMAKRIMDICISSLVLILLAPLLLVIALLIRLDSPGPLMFVQKRVGANGKLFDMYKFRSMHTDVPRYEPSPTTSRDCRITRIGRFLRKTSLDELPQLLNVLLGNMSLVGPRPEMPFLVDLHRARHRRRLVATPGVTGLWQLSADRVLQIHENVQYDLYYIRTRTFFMDLAILVHTAFFAMRGI